MSAVGEAAGHDADATGWDEVAGRVRVLTGVIFIFAGLVKFVFHSWELHAFRTFGLPWPGLLEILAGVVETVGGLMLLLQVMVAPVALALAVTMVVAIGSSGIGHGDVIPSLTLAPALLLALLFLLWRAVPRGAARLERQALPASDDRPVGPS